MFIIRKSNYRKSSVLKLTESAPNFENDDQVRALALLSISLITALLPIWVIASTDVPEILLLSIGIVVTFAATYWFGRSRRYWIGAVLQVVSLFALVVATIFTSPGFTIESVLTLDFVVFAVLASGMFLTKRYTLIAIGGSLFFGGSFFFIPDTPFSFSFSYVVFFTLIASIGWVIVEGGNRGRKRLAIDGSLTARNQAEEVENNSEANFRTLLNIIEDFLFILDMQGNIQEVNQTALERLGYSQSELIGQPLLLIHPEARRGEAAQLIAEVLRGTRRYCPVPIQTKSLDLIPVETYITQGFWNGQPALFGVLKDVSKLKLAEEKLAAVFHANSAIAVLSKVETGACVDVSRTFCEKLGYTPETIMGKKLTDLLHLDVRYRHIISEKLQRDGSVRDEEAILYARDGRPIPVLLSAQILMLHGESYNLTSAVDITAPKRIEEALKESEARHRALLNAIPDLVFRTRRDGIFLDCHVGNPRDLLAPLDTFIGQSIAEILPREFAERHMYHSGRVLTTGQEQIYQYSVPIQGEIADFEARMVVCGQDEVLTIVRNVTKVRLAQRREFEFALERERRQLLTSFVRNAAHEFRTPLATIGTSAYILNRSNDPVQRDQKKTQIEIEIKRITRLIDMMIIMSKLENADSLSTDRVNVNDQLVFVCSELNAKYKDKHTIQFELQPSLPFVMGNADYLSLAFRQLLENAYHFTPENGTIRITSATVRDHIRIEISDTGSGISEDDLPRIFDTFWRQDEAHSTPGFGLGLPIAQKIVQMHNGRIDVVSAIGKGSTFTIFLPQLKEYISPAM